VVLARKASDGERDYELSICRACTLRRRVRLSNRKYAEYLPKDVSGWQNATTKAGRCPVEPRRG